MKRHSGKRMYIWFMAGVILFSITLFWICYQFDNKYTAGGPQADNGLLTLDAATLHDYPVIFLTHGWEIHRGGLLTPEDFAENRRPDEIVYIGQYGGFEGNNPYGNPYGRATYRLNIVIPPEPAAYTLELPEIYSAYRLFINGVQAEQFGNPGPEHYYPQTGNATISFLAQNRVEIIVAAADYSHMYSGMVYPPAFGSPHEVSGMIQTRLTIRAAVCSVAAALALFFLFVGFFMKKDRAMLLFGAICLCFAGYVCYPIVKTIFRGGMGWYGFENFCFCAMLLLVILLQRTISGDKSRLSNLFIAFGVFMCAFSLLRAALPSGDLQLLAAYSMLIGFYKWATAFFLTVNMIRPAGKNTKYGLTMLSGILVFNCALVMDRLLPLFEPILFGWFLEIGGFAIVLTLGIVMGQEALRQYRDKLTLEGKIAGIESLVEMQRAHYPVILESVEEAHRARHDLRHHVNLIQGLVFSDKHDELKAYLQKYAAEVDRLTPLTYCKNDVLDIILRHFAALASQQGIRFKVDAAVPETLPVDNADLCIIISNLLENALEACSYVKGEKSINLAVRQVKNELVILVDNSFDGNVKVQGGGFLSRKRRNREGVGLASVRTAAAKYGGNVEFRPDAANMIFTSVVIIRI